MTGDGPAGLSPGPEDSRDRIARPPTEYQVSADAQAGSIAIAQMGEGSLEMDTTWGQPPSGTLGPGELLAGAFAACLLKNLARTRELIGFDYDHAHVDVVARRQDSPPRFVEIRYTLHITTDEPQRRVDLAHRNLRSHGTIYNTLASVCDVSGDVVAEPVRLPRRPAAPRQ